jgi:hypothetical protein
LASWRAGQWPGWSSAPTAGGYRPLHEVSREYTKRDGKKGKLGAQTTRKGALTLDVLARHFIGAERAHVIGTHSTSLQNVSLAGGVDIDVHDGSTVNPLVTHAAAVFWLEVLRQRGFRPLLTSSNGRGGYHLRPLLREPVPTANLFHFLQQLVSDYRQHGLDAPPDFFPKQPAIDPGRYGNWLRLPGKHHSRDHWSEVWDGQRWLRGEDAVAYILSLEGDSPSLIPPAPAPAKSKARKPRKAAPKSSARSGGAESRFKTGMTVGLGAGIPLLSLAMSQSAGTLATHGLFALAGFAFALMVAVLAVSLPHLAGGWASRQ